MCKTAATGRAVSPTPWATATLRRGWALSPDGRLLASPNDKHIDLDDPVTGRHVRDLERPCELEGDYAFTADGKTLVSGGDDHTVRTWDAATHRTAVLEGHRAAVTAVAACRDLLLTAGKDGAVLLWRGGAVVDRIDLAASDDIPLALAAAPDGKSFAVGTDRGVVLVFALQ